MQRRSLIAAAGATVLAGGLPLAHAQVVDLSDAINKAGRLRMLSQRMGKAWLAVLLSVQKTSAQLVLDKSIALFNRHLVELKAYAPNPEVLATYTKLEAAWSDYQAQLIGKAPARDAAAALLQQEAKVLALAHQGTQQLETHAGKPVGHLVNVAGRQRMLSQRMAKFHLALAWKSAGTEAHQQIEAARKEFVAGLDTLATAPQTTPQIQQQLTLARQQWVFFDAALNRDDNPSKRDAENVFNTSENILQVMDQITGLYARLSA